MKLAALAVFFLCFSFVIHPVKADSVDVGAQMVAKGIESYEKLKADKIMADNYGITFANNSETENMTPSQKLVYVIATAHQSPFIIPWVRETFSYDVIYYMMFSILFIVLSVGMAWAQKECPEQIAAITNRFTGHDGFFDYSLPVTITLKLALYPIAAFFLIDTLMSFEQVLSTGLMKDSLEYISFSMKTDDIWLFESITYAVNASLFAIRIQYINEFTANILKIIILFVAPWGLLKNIAELLGAWFLSSLFMRPIVLWFSSLAVKDIAEQTGEIARVTVTTGDMTIVSIATFFVAVAMVLGPIIWLLIKVLMFYYTGASLRVIRFQSEMNRHRRSEK